MAEYLFTSEVPPLNPEKDPKNQLDLTLWTAARLSATFPYVSPAVRADLSRTALADEQAAFYKHHFVDGGYHDNYGVASALDWLDIVLNAKSEAGADASLPFDRVLIIQLRVSPTGNPRENAEAKGYAAAFWGPLIGLFQIRNGAAYARNEIELDRFVKAWSSRLKDRVEIETVILEPPSEEEMALAADPTSDLRKPEAAPLSWHLTQAQIEALQTQARYLDPCLSQIDRFLDGQPNTLDTSCPGDKRK